MEAKPQDNKIENPDVFDYISAARQRSFCVTDYKWFIISVREENILFWVRYRPGHNRKQIKYKETHKSIYLSYEKAHDVAERGQSTSGAFRVFKTRVGNQQPRFFRTIH